MNIELKCIPYFFNHLIEKTVSHHSYKLFIYFTFAVFCFCLGIGLLGFFFVLSYKEWWCWQNIVHTTVTLWWNFLRATGGPYESTPNPANPDRNKIMKVAPNDVCFPAQMQREGTVLEINQSSVMFCTGWGSLCVKVGTRIVFSPMWPQVEGPMKRGLGCIMVRIAFRAKRWCQLHRSWEKGTGVNVMQHTEYCDREPVLPALKFF